MTGEQRFLAACRLQPVDATPVWYMRQAGRGIAEYERMRERYGVLGIARTPELAARASVLPVAAYGVDAAVMYADVMLPTGPMGVDFELTAEGPVLASPIRTADDVARLRVHEPEDELAFAMEAIRLARHELDGRQAVIGIAGGPFTLAAYLIEGRASRDQATARAFMYTRPAAWHDLLGRLAEVGRRYLAAQVPSQRRPGPGGGAGRRGGGDAARRLPGGPAPRGTRLRDGRLRPAADQAVRPGATSWGRVNQRSASKSGPSSSGTGARDGAGGSARIARASAR